MKIKTLRRGASLLASLGLLCALLLACSGCSGDKDKLVGDWESSVDMTSMINDAMMEGLEGDEELMSYFTVDNFSVTFILSFQDDGTYKFTVDEATMEQSIDRAIDTFRTGATRYFEDMIAAEGLDLTVDEVLEQMGYTMDDFLDAMISKEDMMSSIDDMENSGTFEAKSGMLHLSGGGEETLDPYTLDGTTLTLTGEGVDQGDLAGLYPLVFTKK